MATEWSEWVDDRNSQQVFKFQVSNRDLEAMDREVLDKMMVAIRVLKGVVAVCQRDAEPMEGTAEEVPDIPIIIEGQLQIGDGES